MVSLLGPLDARVDASETSVFEDILVVTDRDDLAEEPVRHRSARERRFLARLKGLLLDLAFPTGGRHRDPESFVDEIEIQTENATRQAIDLASGIGARLHVLLIVDAVRYDTSLDSATDPLVDEGEASVEELVGLAEGSGVEAEGRVAVGRPADLVLEYVEANGVDLIVLNARQDRRLGARFRRDLVDVLGERASVPIHLVPRAGRGRPD